MAENGRKKRPASFISSLPSPREENEEQQVEEFFDLLDNIMAVKDLLRGNDTNKRVRKDALGSIWKPRFELEDFEGVDKIKDKSAMEVKAKEGGGIKGGDKCSCSLDLNLAL